jgi:para-nitrobenzyl esterase
MFPVLLSSRDAQINVKNGINNWEEVPYIEPIQQDFGLNKSRNKNPIYTSSGVVKGEFHRGVYIWEDIPYALPPVGELRWKAPRKIEFSSELILPKTKNFCIQRTSNFGGSAEYADEDDLLSGSEDCLYLDVFAPLNKSKKLLPVMFWIHGGGNTSGLKDLYDFRKLVKKHDVIVVRINYRLGPFGWFTHPAIQGFQNDVDKTSNFGTLDIISALEWVNENITLFGGDSNNITIFGESAGGHNVLSLLVSKRAKGLFHKAISMSGYTTSFSTENAYRQDIQSFSSDHTSWKIVNKIVNDVSQEKKQSEYENKEIRKILLNLSGNEFYEYYADRETFEEIPLLTNDGIVIPEVGLREALSMKEYINNVPTMIGSNRDEVKFWLAFSEYFVELDYSFGSSFFGLPKIILKDEDLYEAFNYYRSNAWKIRGVDEPLNFLADAGNKKLYSYRFDWDDQRRFVIANFKQIFGATHALEVPLLAGDNSLVGGRPVSNFIYPKGVSNFYMSKNMMKFWTNFAKTGEPGLSSNNVMWGPYTANKLDVKSFMVLDNKKNLRMSSEMSSLENLTKELFYDERLNELEKCVVLYQMFTFVGNDLYDENIKNYPGNCNRNSSEQFIKENASIIDYD